MWSHHDQFQGANLESLKEALGRDAHSWLWHAGRSRLQHTTLYMMEVVIVCDMMLDTYSIRLTNSILHDSLILKTISFFKYHLDFHTPV